MKSLMLSILFLTKAIVFTFLLPFKMSSSEECRSEIKHLLYFTFYVFFIVSLNLLAKNAPPPSSIESIMKRFMTGKLDNLQKPFFHVIGEKNDQSFIFFSGESIGGIED